MVLEYADTTDIQNVAFYRTNVTGTPNSSDLIGNTGPLAMGAIFSFGNYAANKATNDVDFLITSMDNTTQKSRFHLSCSDPEMNDVTDCGNLEGNGKQNVVAGGNLWLLRDLQGQGKFPVRSASRDDVGDKKGSSSHPTFLFFQTAARLVSLAK